MHIASGAGFISNIILLRESGYFDSAADLKPLLHLWSLGIEEQFYIFWPLLIAIIWRWRINPLLIIGLITITSFSLNIRGVDKNAIAAFYSPQTRFWELSIGAIVAYCQLRPSNNVVSFLSTIDSFLSKFNSFRKNKDANSLNSILGMFLSLFGIACIGYGIFYLSGSVKYPGYWALLPTLGTVCLICAGPNAWINHVFLSNKFMVCVGLISYPIYLWHWLLLSYARIIEGAIPSIIFRVFLLFWSFVLAWLTYFFVERPIRYGSHQLPKTLSVFWL